MEMFNNGKQYHIRYSVALKNDYLLTQGQTVTFGALVGWFNMSRANRQACNPSIKTLAKYSGQSYDAVKDHIPALENLGLIKVNRKKKANGENHSNEYLLPQTILERYFEG